MGWSMFLECQFATIATALATGGYVAFLFDPDAPSSTVATWAALATVLIFFLLQVWGVKEQSLAMIIMTYGAIVGLVIFWVAAGTNFSWDRVWTNPVLPAAKGWHAVLDAVPYCSVVAGHHRDGGPGGRRSARAAPHDSPRAGLGAVDADRAGRAHLAVRLRGDAELHGHRGGRADGKDVSYPLAKVIGSIPVGKSPVVVYGFGIIALFGMIASYHGMIYGTSRQAFALGRAGYLPGFLGKVHTDRRTPVASLAVCSLITAGFVVANLWFDQAVAVAVLVSTLTALIWYILAMGCLFVLRRREPDCSAMYRALCTHAAGRRGAAFGFCRLRVQRHRRQGDSAHRAVVRAGRGLFLVLGAAAHSVRGARGVGSSSRLGRFRELAHDDATHKRFQASRAAHAPLLFFGGDCRRRIARHDGALGWILVASYRPDWLRLASLEAEVIVVVALFVAALLLVSLIALLHTRD